MFVSIAITFITVLVVRKYLIDYFGIKNTSKLLNKLNDQKIVTESNNQKNDQKICTIDILMIRFYDKYKKSI